jgi:hypothetical protein
MDIIGKRGESLFGAIITRWCGGEQWFDHRFLGDKAEALDFEVTLLGSSVFHASFFVQVRATAKAKRYAGTGMGRKLLVRLTAADAKKLGGMKMPAYVVGIDVLSGMAYVRHVPGGAKKGFVGISTRRSLNCRAIRRIWNDVENFWKSRPGGMTKSSV